MNCVIFCELASRGSYSIQTSDSRDMQKVHDYKRVREHDFERFRALGLGHRLRCTIRV